MLSKDYTHQGWMKHALNLISSSSEIKTEVPICALIVKNNELISYGFNEVEKKLNPTLHAEITAISKACETLNTWRLNDTVLYCTLEPCSMCTGAIINARIPKIIFGAYDKDFGTCGTKINLFHDLKKDVEVIGGILEEECSTLLKDFFNNLR